MVDIKDIKNRSFQPPADSILEALKNRHRDIVLTGLSGSSRAWIVAGLFQARRHTILVIAQNAARAEQFHQDLVSWMDWLGNPPGDTAYFPEGEIITPDKPLLFPDHLRQRLQILYRLALGDPQILIVPEDATNLPVPAEKILLSESRRVINGSTVVLDDFLADCIRIGYRRVDLVEQIGEFSVRGGLVDLFSPSLDHPQRIELSGNTIESMRLFDPETQISKGEISEFIILPVAQGPQGLTSTLTDYLPPEAILVWNDKGVNDPQIEPHDTSPLDPATHGPPRKTKGIFQMIYMEGLDLAGPPMPDSQKVQIKYSIRTPESLGLGFPGSPLTKTLPLLDTLRQKTRILLAAKSTAQQKRLLALFHEHNLPAVQYSGDLPKTQPMPFVIAVGNLSHGFFEDNNQIGVLTDEDLFGKAVQPRPLPRSKPSRFFTSLEDLKISDYIVHVHHGIGQYRGLRRLTIDGYESDFLMIRYSRGDTLYVPLDGLNLVQKYTGVEGQHPPLDRLGGGTWARTTKRVKKAAEAVAQELLELYAARQISTGHAFSLDKSLIGEFEAAFEFDETPDQLQSIQEVRQDMEKSRPMDRLICGDVGYGKTEVAMRAAFQAVMDNKQVAILVPTTLLAQQHYQNFKQRFAPFPVVVEMLSRFRSPKDQKAVLGDLEKGKVDILIGTHRLLQKDVLFPNLGLLIVDEEQRFGVSHKERLKQFRTNVDVLTLTATPIPRTLQMSMVGIRDFSVIETPPPDRLAIRTILSGFSPPILRTAILKELSRKGQIFFVHNRIEDIERIGNFLKDLVPEARIAVAHGQMRERMLESVMLKFVLQEFDLLLSTAIIESGLDIPTVNTIFINNAHQFGLSELYQLRGRVGRSGIQAYAYFLVPSETGLTSDARKRLEALQEFCELGSGFRIAARDLEIRGAGNLLGRNQSGHVEAVGFEFYLQLIEKAVNEFRGTPREEEIDPIINLQVSAFIPDDYIPDVYQRLSLYKRLADMKMDGALSPLWAEVTDRYGPPPKTVRTLWEVIQIKILSRALGIEKLSSISGGVKIAFHPKRKLSDRQIRDLLENRSEIHFSSEYSIKLVIADPGWASTYPVLKNFLQTLLRYDRSRFDEI